MTSYSDVFSAILAMDAYNRGYNPHTIALVLDHISATKASVTNSVHIKYSFVKEKRPALETWVAQLEQLTTDSERGGENVQNSQFEN